MSHEGPFFGVEPKFIYSKLGFFLLLIDTAVKECDATNDHMKYKCRAQNYCRNINKSELLWLTFLYFAQLKNIKYEN